MTLTTDFILMQRLTEH